MVPSGSNRLKNSAQHNEVNIQVVIDGIEESETPVEAEDGRGSGTDNAENDSDDLLA